MVQPATRRKTTAAKNTRTVKAGAKASTAIAAPMVARRALIKTIFMADDAERAEILERVRLCTSLTKPWLLPPLGHNPSMRLPETYQSTGSRGVTNLEGLMLLALYPPGSPWFELGLHPSLEYSTQIEESRKARLRQRFYLDSLTTVGMLESASLKPLKSRQVNGFRSSKRSAIGQIIVTGDTLERLDDDFRLTTFRRDRYVTRRDSAGNVLYHAIRESIDPFALRPDELARTKLNVEELKKIDTRHRMQDLWTYVEWQPWSNVWVIRQEVNDQTIVETQETISNYFSTPFELAPEEHYGRGLIELNLGDLRSLNNLMLRMLDFAAACSKFLFGIDNNSSVKPEDLEKPSGASMRCKVENGEIKDVAILQIQKSQDFSVVRDVAATVRDSLAKNFLIEAELQPKGERVTAYQVGRIAQMLEGALGGVYAPIAEKQQMPLLQRAIHQLRLKRILPVVPDDTMEVRALTGLAALTSEAKRGKLMSFSEVARLLPPDAAARMDWGVFMDAWARYSTLYEPGLIKSDDQMRRESLERQRTEAGMMLAQQAIQTGGKVVEHQLTSDQEPQAQRAAA